MKQLLLSLFLIVATVSCEYADFRNNKISTLITPSIPFVITIDNVVENTVIDDSNQSGFLVEGQCNSAGASVTFSIGIGSTTCDGSNYSVNIDLSGEANGSLSLQATLSDSSGQVQNSDSVTLIKNVPPVTTLVYSILASGETVSLPLRDGFAYNFTVDWGDGSPTASISSGTDPDRLHSYSSPGTYTVTWTGTAEAMRSTCDNPSGTNNRLLEAHLDDMGWVNMEEAFLECTLLTDVSISNTSGVTTMSRMFESTFDLANLDTTNWDTYNVTNMQAMFEDALLAEPDTSGWDTSNVTDMSNMFDGAGEAAPDTTNWNTSNVTNMNSLFYDAPRAQPDTSGWDTSNVTDMARMFGLALIARPDTSGWDTSNVTDMNSMFRQAANAEPDTSGWDTSNVTNMSSMFLFASLATPDTSGWDTSNVTNMQSMFASAVNATPDTSGWDTSNVTSMSSMFQGASSANPITSGWNTSQVTDMGNMFDSAVVAVPDTSGWDTSSVTDMQHMFEGAVVANPDTSAWNTSNVERFDGMFDGAINASPVVSSWDFSSHRADSVFTSYMQDVFRNSAITNTEYSNFLLLLDNTRTLGRPADLGDIPAQYNSSAAAARANLLSAGYTLSDNGAE